MKAAALYKLAADVGFTHAQAALGDMYLRGEGGLPKNLRGYQMNLSPGYFGATLTIIYKGPGGGRWVSTYVSDDTQGNFVAHGDPTNPFYNGNFTNSDQFYNSPGTNLYGWYEAQVSLVQPNGSGGYSAAFTFTWGYTWTQGGQFFPVRPVIAPIWPSQQQNIGLLH
jgi:hypothetical protein